MPGWTDTTGFTSPTACQAIKCCLQRGLLQELFCKPRFRILCADFKKGHKNLPQLLFLYFSERLLVPKEKKVKKNRSILLTSCEHSFLGKGSFKKANQVPWLLSSPKPCEVHRVGSSFTAYMGKSSHVTGQKSQDTAAYYSKSKTCGPLFVNQNSLQGICWRPSHVSFH